MSQPGFYSDYRQVIRKNSYKYGVYMYYVTFMYPMGIDNTFYSRLKLMYSLEVKDCN